MYLLDRKVRGILRLTLDHQSEGPDGQHLIDNADAGSLCCCNAGIGCQAVEVLAVGGTAGPIMPD